MADDLLPYFKFFPAEALADEWFGAAPMEQRGVWLTLLLYAWVNGSIPADPVELARMLRLRRDSFARIWAGVGPRFATHPALHGRLTSTRLEVERQSALTRRHKARESAMVKWSQPQETGDANAMRTQSERNASNTAQRSAAQKETTPLPPRPGGLGEVGEVWARLCVPAGFAPAKATAQQRKAAASRLREAGWLDAFRSACAYVAKEPFYRGASSSGWVLTLGWLLKPGNAEKTAERAATKRTNGRSKADPEILAAIAENERYLSGAEPLQPEPSGSPWTGGSEPLPADADGLAAVTASLPPPL